MKTDIFVTVSVLFEDPFWAMLIEREYGRNKYDTCKVTLGAEPKDYEVYNYLLAKYDSLKFGRAVLAERCVVKHDNPKTVQRKVKRQIEKSTAIGTKAQNAIKFNQEQNKIAKKTISKEQKQAESKARFEQKKQKKIEKHNGK